MMPDLSTTFLSRRSSRAPLALALALVLGAACAARPAPADAPAGDPPVVLTAARALLMPLPAGAGLAGFGGETLDAALLFALREQTPGATWTGPAELRRLLARSPGYAPAPDRIPAFEPRGPERRVAEPLAGHLRRYAALAGARLVVLPFRAAAAPGDSTAVELHLAIVDVRSDRAVWLGVHRDARPQAGDAGALAVVAARAAARLFRAPGEGAAQGSP